jgi:hypothetical protein
VLIAFELLAVVVMVVVVIVVVVVVVIDPGDGWDVELEVLVADGDSE